MSSRSRSWNSNRSRSSNQSLAGANRARNPRWNNNNRWNNRRWSKWNRNWRYPNRYYPYYNYPYYSYPYVSSMIDYPATFPLSSNAPSQWFYNYPYYYYYYGFPYNRWFRVYAPMNTTNPLYIPPVTSNLLAVNDTDNAVNTATIYTVPEGFEAETTKTVTIEGSGMEDRIQNYNNLSDFVMYDNMVKTANTNYFMYGVILLILILFLVILFN